MSQACIRYDRRMKRVGGISGAKLVEQLLRLFEIRRVEAFGEPAVKGRENVTGLRDLALVAPEVREILGGTELKRFRCLDPGNLQGAAEGRHNVGTFRTIEPPKRFSLEPCDIRRKKGFTGLIDHLLHRAQRVK